MIEQVELQIFTPSANLGQIDEAVKRLQILHEWQEKVAGMRRIKITAQIEGDEQLQAFLGTVGQLGEKLKGLGFGDVGMKVAKGILSAGEAAKLAAGEVARLQQRINQLDASLLKRGVQISQIDRGHPAYANLETAFRAESVERAGLRDRMANAQHAAGLADALSGLGEVELQAATAAKTAEGALAGQEKVVRSKTGEVRKLAAETKAAAKTEKELAEAAAEAAAAEKRAAEVTAARARQGQPGLLRERTTTTADDERVAQTFLTGAGLTRTISGDKTVDELNQLEKFKVRFEQIKAGFAGKRGEANGLGVSDLLRQEAKEMSAALAEMQAAGLEGTKDFAGRSARVGSLGERANTLDRAQAARAAAVAQREAAAMEKEARRQLADTQRDVSQRITAGLREEAGALDRRRTAALQSVTTDQQRIDTLRRLADEHDRLAKIIGGTRETDQRQRLRLGVEQRGTAMRGEADALERKLQAEAAQIKALHDRYEAQMKAFGGQRRERSTLFDAQGGRTTTERAVRDRIGAPGEQDVMTKVTSFNAAGQVTGTTLHELSGKLGATRRGLVDLGKTFLANVGTVALWGAAVQLVMKITEGLTHGIESAIKIERQFATLQTVFRGTRDEALGLRNSVLELAAGTGRSTDEAMDAAVRWSRLGLNAKDASEAVRVSLMAANVAEISAADAGEQLAAIYASQKIEVSGLSVVLDEMNSVSNNLNVTVKDLLAGIGRTGAIAKEAGIPLSELIGIIGAGVATTGRSGSEIGNAIKKMIVSVANPDTQKALNDLFRFNVKDQLGGFKDASTLLSEMFVKVNQLDKGARTEFLQKLGGAQQASRLEAILDSYVTGEVRAIKAARDLGSAERENITIRQTVISQWGTLSSEFERFFTLAGGGPLKGVAEGLRAISGALHLVNDVFENFHGDNQLLKFLTSTPLTQLGMGLSLVREQGVKAGILEPSEEQNSAALEWQRNRTNSERQTARLFGSMAKVMPGMDDESFHRTAFTLGAVAENPKFAREMEEARRLGDLSRQAALLAAEKAAANQRAAEQAAREAKMLNEQADALKKLIAAKEKEAPSDKRDREVGELEDKFTRLKGKAALYAEQDAEADVLSEPAKMMQRMLAQQHSGLGEIFGAQPSIFGTETEKTRRQLQAVEEERRQLSISRLDAPNQIGPPTHDLFQVRTQVASQLDSTRIEKEQLESKLLADKAADNLREGAKRAARESIRFQVGDNESDRLLHEARGIVRQQIPAADAAAGRDPNIRVGFLQQSGARLTEIEAAAATRLVTLHKEIVDLKRQENEQSGRAILFADREDQLRAALLKRYVEQHGAFSAAQLAFSDQSTKRALKEFVPEGLPAEARTPRQEAERELSLLTQSMDELRKLIASGRSAAGREGARAPDFGAGAGRPGPPSINLPPITFNLSNQFEALANSMRSLFESRMTGEIRAMQQTLDRAISAGAVGRARGGGAASINTGG